MPSEQRPDTLAQPVTVAGVGAQGVGKTLDLLGSGMDVAVAAIRTPSAIGAPVTGFSELLLRGEGLEAVRRGGWLVEPGAGTTSSRLRAVVRSLCSPQPGALQVHICTADTPAEPGSALAAAGQTAEVELDLARAVPVETGARFAVRAQGRIVGLGEGISFGPS